MLLKLSISEWNVICCRGISISSNLYKFVIAFTYFSRREIFFDITDISSNISSCDTKPLGIKESSIVAWPFSKVKGVRKSCEKAAFKRRCSANCRNIVSLFFDKQSFIFSKAWQSFPISSFNGYDNVKSKSFASILWYALVNSLIGFDNFFL